MEQITTLESCQDGNSESLGVPENLSRKTVKSKLFPLQNLFFLNILNLHWFTEEMAGKTAGTLAKPRQHKTY